MSDKFAMNNRSLFRLYTKEMAETFNISVFNGAVSAVVFKRDSSEKGPIIRISLSSEACIKLAEICEKVITSSGPLRIPFTQISYNRDTRTYEPTANLVIFKDEKNMFGLEVTGAQHASPIVFSMKASNTFTIGNESLSDEEKSLLVMKHLAHVFRHETAMARMLGSFVISPAPDPYNKSSFSRSNTSTSSTSSSNSDPYSVTSEDGSVFG